MSASTSITSGFDALVTPNICILNAPIRNVSLLPPVSRLSDDVGVDDGGSDNSHEKRSIFTSPNNDTIILFSTFQSISHHSNTSDYHYYTNN